MFKVFRNLLDRSQPADVHPVEPELTLVALVTDEGDRALLSHLAIEHGWTIHFARTFGEAWEALNSYQAQIILLEREGPGTDWRGVVQKMVSAPNLVCAILISKVADNYLWNEVILWGGHDVLATPLREESVVRAVRLAWLYWNSAMKGKAGAA
jgi:DNA-binding response OmpR family regulator